ncbi:MAG TPA: hypothetical protein VNL16_18200 [Chloroflexota bacterium]|nr:hypothetical protein [Chloroflexota bacterium]
MIDPCQAPARALVRWQHAAGPYWPYVCSAPFVGPWGATLGTNARTRACARLLEEVAAIPPGERAAVFVDLPPRLTLPATAALNDLGYVVVPVIQRWIVAPATLDCRRLVDDLIIHGARVRLPRPARGAVFLLDGDRAGPLRREGRPAPRRVFDNRYSYPACRFPPAAFLHHEGITSAWWISGAGIADDARQYAEAAGMGDDWTTKGARNIVTPSPTARPLVQVADAGAAASHRSPFRDLFVAFRALRGPDVSGVPPGPAIASAPRDPIVPDPQPRPADPHRARPAD